MEPAHCPYEGLAQKSARGVGAIYRTFICAGKSFQGRGFAGRAMLSSPHFLSASAEANFSLSVSNRSDGPKAASMSVGV